jgi:protein-S-isoprenylcysteine O-methyltransferase Ste14
MTAPTPSASRVPRVRDPGPDVKFPPPLLFTLPLLLAWGIDRLLHTPRLPDQSWLAVPGGLMALGGFALVLWGIRTFNRFRTAVYPNRAAKLVVDTGPFAFTRNPMYVGMTLFYLGVVLLLRSWTALVLLPAVHVLLWRFVIRKEERHLLQKFPEAYAAYCARVPRWLWPGQ